MKDAMQEILEVRDSDEQATSLNEVREEGTV
jgi:hypothetical protein